MTRVRVGIDGLIEDPDPIAGRKFGLITNPSGLTSQGVPSWKALGELPWGQLARLFGPEHGVDGGAIYMESVANAVHPPTGLPAVSLYGDSVESLKPRREDLEGLEALVFDVADVGSRYYTFLWTMMLAMEAAADVNARFIVCDRPNPIGGAVEGAAQELDLLSFVGLHPVPVRHGLTAGEMARLLAAERKLDLDLVVVRVEGWAREMPFEATALAWVPPSPNMPTVETTLAYPGMCLLEGTNLSEGRGTTSPFLRFGAPWLSPLELAEALNALELPGVSFLPTHFRPLVDKHAGQTCGGAQMRVTDAAVFRSFQTGLRVIETARRLDPKAFRWRTEPYEFDRRPAIDLLTGSTRFRRMVDAEQDLDPEIARHDAGARAFLERRSPHLLYPDRKPAVVAFVGGHNAGKTRLIAGLLPKLQARGLRLGTIKHTTKDAEDDIAGKDSDIHAKAGASVGAFVTPERTTARRFGPEEPLEALLTRAFADCDLVLVEGYKSLPVPKVEVTRAGISRPPVPGAALRVGDGVADDGVPTLRTDDLDGVAAAVLHLAGLDRLTADRR
jgi:molybdopterin-guanine dinucleotide biosynthesis protein MobB